MPDKTITTFFKNLWPKKEFEEAIYDKNPKRKKTDPSIAGLFRAELRKLQRNNSSKDYIVVLQRTIGDFISGMTDSFALRQYEKLYGSSELKNYLMG